MRTLKHLPVNEWPEADSAAFRTAYEPGDVFDETAGIPSLAYTLTVPAGPPWSTTGSTPGSRDAIRTLPRDAGCMAWTKKCVSAS